MVYLFKSKFKKKILKTARQKGLILYKRASMQSVATLPSESDWTKEGSGVTLKVQKEKTK